MMAGSMCLYWVGLMVLIVFSTYLQVRWIFVFALIADKKSAAWIPPGKLAPDQGRFWPCFFCISGQHGGHHRRTPVTSAPLYHARLLLFDRRRLPGIVRPAAVKPADPSAASPGTDSPPALPASLDRCRRNRVVRTLAWTWRPVGTCVPLSPSWWPHLSVEPDGADSYGCGPISWTCSRSWASCCPPAHAWPLRPRGNGSCCSRHWTPRSFQEGRVPRGLGMT